MRPNRQIVRRFTTRGFLLWLGVRLLASAVIALAGTNPLRMEFSSALVLIATCVAVGLADMHRRHEWVLLANLAVSRHDAIAFFAVPAIVAEVVIMLVGSAVS